MTLTPAHKELIRLLAEIAVEEFYKEQDNLLQVREKPRTGECPHVPHRDH